MEIRLKLFVQDFLSYLLFLTLLVLVVRGHRDPGEYFFRKTLEDVIVHKHFQEVSESDVNCNKRLIKIERHNCNR